PHGAQSAPGRSGGQPADGTSQEPAQNGDEAAPGDEAPAGEAPADETPGHEPPAAEAPKDEEQPDDGRFKVVLDNFEGPFDLLLQLISKHKLDVTEVALSKVTDEFMSYIHAMGPDWDLDQTTEFLVVAATLLDLKAARLLPSAEVEDEADLALLEARDLLFARLLQYRAYKEIAGIFARRMADEAHRHPRTVGLEPHHAELLPEVAISIGPEGFARLAVKAMQPKPKPQVYVEHIHAPLVSVREQAELVVARLRELGEVTFQQLTEDAPDTLTVVARFLALLELYRERAVSLDQEEALGLLMVRWSGEEGAEPVVTDEFDQEPRPQQPEDQAESGQEPQPDDREQPRPQRERPRPQQPEDQAGSGQEPQPDPEPQEEMQA
ncbi:segregation and condensation protein A, partial [Streptomyces albidus (ex Kaewkla and Franco 2022)]|uniref:segregation and condensation protein A n=1 Tax=Streptomyces albidus (ex Kaewkla and Franco 2022) TaxID=722709 RepID=UPI001F32CF88